MSHDTSRKVSPVGYMEVYYRIAPRTKRINKKSQLLKSDYEKIMGPVPISEFDSPIQLLKFIKDDWPRYKRPPQEGDLFVMRLKSEECGWQEPTISLVVDVKGDRMAHLHTRATRIMWGDESDKTFNLGLLIDNLKFQDE